VKIGRNVGVKYPSAFELPSDAEVAHLLEHAFDAGLRLFDTAPAYGSSELRLRDFVARHRDNIALVSKAGEDFEDGVSRHDFSAAGIIASCERSLTRLGTDRLDLLLLHSDGTDEAGLCNSEAAAALMQLRERGLVSAIGISAKTAAGVEAAVSSLDVVMAPFSLVQQDLAATLSLAHESGIGIVAIKTLASGHSATPAAALRFVLEQQFVDAAVIGTLRAEHLDTAIEVARSLKEQAP
jgi:aryl-alcohol dehydrogenase-like predicted oxidoreductase